MVKNRIVLVIPFYNCKEFLEGCIASVLSQDYDNFKAICIDDASTDGGWDVLPHGDDRFVCLRNDKNLTALPNIHRAVMEYTEPDDIIGLLDGDDKLLKRNSLSTLNNIYNENDCWVVWSLAQWSDGRPGLGSAYQNEEEYKNQRRMFNIRYSHLRSFRAGLYKKIEEQDPTFSTLKDANGEFYKVTYDVAIFADLFNLAPFSKALFSPTPLYWYNRGNPLSDDKIRQAEQWRLHEEISRKPDLKQIESYK